MLLFDLYIIKSGRCYIVKTYKENLHITDDIKGAKIFHNEIEAHNYLRKFNYLDYKVVKLVEEVGLDAD